MTQFAAKPQPEVVPPQPATGEPSLHEIPAEDLRELQAKHLRVLWDRRSFLFRAGLAGLVASGLIAFLIPKSYTSTAQLMPPDEQSTSGLAMMAAMASKVGGGLGSMAGDLLGLKSSGALFVGMLRSETAQDHVIQQFDLQKVYGGFGRPMLLVDARKKLDENTSISEDRKSGIISISVTDHDAKRAAGIANAYVDELNSLVAELSTSAAHRERVFLEGRLKVAKADLDDASSALAQFSSKNNTLDIQTEGKAMLDAAGTLAGELIAAQSELQGLRQIYTDNNPRVRSLNARVVELRKQLERLGGTQDKAATETLSTVNGAAGAPSTGAADPPPTPASDPLSSGRVGGMPFPTIRNLPLLGAKYSDYYRRAKIQETVFELLTEQFELAKVEEAKETPSVKVLDPARVPQKKSFPPRLLILVLGTFLAGACSVVWVLGSKVWEEADASDPRKILALEVAATLRAHAPWSQNGSGPQTRTQKIWSRLSQRKPPADDSAKQ